VVQVTYIDQEIKIVHMDGEKCTDASWWSGPTGRSKRLIAAATSKSLAGICDFEFYM
jgi:hypothetical protein